MIAEKPQKYYDPDRKLVNMVKLCEKYNVTQINVRYQTPITDKLDYITIPVNVELFKREKVWMTYNTKTEAVRISQNQIGMQNYWVTQLLDDVKNHRIDLGYYCYAN